jgi:hypothetical protein
MGIGVAGFALGGGIHLCSNPQSLASLFPLPGYSWKANQYGLTIDSITAFELVEPTGKISVVTESSDPELFFGLRVGAYLVVITISADVLSGWSQQLCWSFFFLLYSFLNRNRLFSRAS